LGRVIKDRIFSDCFKHDINSHVRVPRHVMINPQILTPCPQLIRYIFVVFNARNTEISHIHLEKNKM